MYVGARYSAASRGERQQGPGPKNSFPSTILGFEPRILGFEDRCLIHWAIRPMLFCDRIRIYILFFPAIHTGYSGEDEKRVLLPEEEQNLRHFSVAEENEELTSTTLGFEPRISGFVDRRLIQLGHAVGIGER